MELLEVLTEKMGCEYLSDLRYLKRQNNMLRRAVSHLPLTRFRSLEWLDAADYLCGVKCKNAREARNELLLF